MLIGGMAVLVHGVPRLTRDIDVTISLPLPELPRLRDALRAEFRLLVEEPREFIEETRVLPVEGPDGTRVDIVFAGLPFEEDAIRRAEFQRLGTQRVRVCTPADLILHKIVSTRTRDREDVAGILSRSGPSMDLEGLDATISALALDLELPEILEFWLGLRAE